MSDGNGANGKGEIPDPSGDEQDNGRDEKGRFRPGFSGNIAGRPPGVKDYRREFLDALEAKAEAEGVTLAEVAIRIAYNPEHAKQAEMVRDLMKKVVPDLHEAVADVTADQLEKLHAEREAFRRERLEGAGRIGWNREDLLAGRELMWALWLALGVVVGAVAMIAACFWRMRNWSPLG